MSSNNLNSSNPQGGSRGQSPRVTAVLKAVWPKGMSQLEMAQKTGLNHGVLNQLVKENGRTKATPKLIGRICACLPPKAATMLLEAYLQEVAESLWKEQSEVGAASLPTKVRRLSVRYPPSSD